MAIEQLGPVLYGQGKEQLKNIIVEDPAESIINDLTGTDAVLVAMATGMNAVLVGEPGGGKSILSSDAHRIIKDIQFDDVAKVPHTADLTAERLIGATVPVTKTITDEKGKTTTEEVKSEIRPILTPATKVIWLDEINRVSPFAINGVLGALENGKIITDAGVLTLEGLEWAISTMNPHNKSQATFRLDPATVSRHPIGMVMGDEESGTNPDVPDAILDSLMMENWEPQPEKIGGVIDLNQLHQIRSDVNSLTIPSNLHATARGLMANMLKTWRVAHDVQEAKGRAAKQFSRIARGLGVLRNGSPEVTEADLRDAAALISCARLAMGARLEYSELRSALHEISQA